MSNTIGTLARLQRSAISNGLLDQVGYLPHQTNNPHNAMAIDPYGCRCVECLTMQAIPFANPAMSLLR